MSIGRGNSSLFEPKHFNFKSFDAQCKKDFGVSLALVGSLPTMEARYMYFNNIQ
jgi:hypothetical protein